MDGRCGVLVGGQNHGVLLEDCGYLCPDVVVEEVGGLDVEEALAHVAMHVGLITVEAKPLSVPFLLLR